MCVVVYLPSSLCVWSYGDTNKRNTYKFEYFFVLFIDLPLLFQFRIFLSHFYKFLSVGAEERVIKSNKKYTRDKFRYSKDKNQRAKFKHSAFSHMAYMKDECGTRDY